MRKIQTLRAIAEEIEDYRTYARVKYQNILFDLRNGRYLILQFMSSRFFNFGKFLDAFGIFLRLPSLVFVHVIICISIIAIQPTGVMEALVYYEAPATSYDHSCHSRPENHKAKL